MPTQRQEKIQHVLKEEISEILRREMKDPRLGFITITDAEITPDLRSAKIFVSVLGTPEERDENMQILKNAQHFIRQALKKRIKMKVLPDIEFRLDTSIDRSIRMLELLEQIKKNEESHESEE